MGEGQGKRSRTANHLPVGVVLGAVARALELVLGLVPRDDAAQVRAHSVQPEVREGTILLDDQVRGVTLQALRERVVARQVRLEPFSLLDVVTIRVLSRLTGAAAAGAVRSKQFYPSVSSRCAHYCSIQSQERRRDRFESLPQPDRPPRGVVVEFELYACVDRGEIEYRSIACASPPRHRALAVATARSAQSMAPRRPGVDRYP